MVARRILYQTQFHDLEPGWGTPSQGSWGSDGLLLDPSHGHAALSGPGIHTRNDDSIELHFDWTTRARGSICFGFAGGMESALATVDFGRQKKAQLHTSDWSAAQPVTAGSVAAARGRSHVLRLTKSRGAGELLPLADITVELDDRVILAARRVNVLPELGVSIEVHGAPVCLRRFVHRGQPSGVPEYLHVGGWQHPNTPDIAANLGSICRGLELAAERGMQLLVMPETSLTGLFPVHPVTQDPRPIAAAEAKLRRYIKALPNAPYVVVGYPVWDNDPAHDRMTTRYNVSRLFDPDGHPVDTFRKIHSCETEFWHGFRLQEFDIHGVPVCMHICHDGRYPETWTLPVMFGARLILHPSNGGAIRGSVDAFEQAANRSTSTSHAFYLHVNGGGGSYIAGPQKFDNVLDVSAECRRENAAFPMVGRPQECLIESRIRVADAFGYWPVRSLRASEEIAGAQLALYRSLGGKRS
jgi:predicted amidohydrolase